jgi:hypothetical protein
MTSAMANDGWGLTVDTVKSTASQPEMIGTDMSEWMYFLKPSADNTKLENSRPKVCIALVHFQRFAMPQLDSTTATRCAGEDQRQRPGCQVGERDRIYGRAWLR